MFLCYLNVNKSSEVLLDLALDQASSLMWMALENCAENKGLYLFRILSFIRGIPVSNNIKRL